MIQEVLSILWTKLVSDINVFVNSRLKDSAPVFKCYHKCMIGVTFSPAKIIRQCPNKEHKCNQKAQLRTKTFTIRMSNDTATHLIPKIVILISHTLQDLDLQPKQSGKNRS